jgi:hypothetical protein
MNGIEIISAERSRQGFEEGWTSSHDDQHTDQSLAQAAACYAWPAPRPPAVKKAWPWDQYLWKPSTQTLRNGAPENIDGRIRDLAKAGALIAAEIDRLQRMKEEMKDGPFGLGHIDGSE